ncbi:LysR family transcriptional regulator [Burkholderia anthinoferrum]|uniref:LysR family transcriptional regulator n=1 Tax=Burkholderia anthinoferrum TaxID=3090833 RepID=UPI002B24395F|nr:LysR family transcriptional regulator [Burkholderia anthinoferrum]MEB2560532.1 LysR family transcriptional regulator [Burkholderia anthinoferrum]
MDRIQAMEVFTRVVDANSFTRAADTLSMPRASVTTIIQNLEALLGVRLMHRTTRRLSLTPEGAAYYEHCMKIIAEIAEADASFQAGNRKPSGMLRVHMPSSLGRRIVLPSLSTFRQRYPDITLELGLSDRYVDPVEEGIDCMIRVGPLEDSSMVARRIGMLKRVTCASPDYLARHGEPNEIADLVEHQAVNFRASHGARTIPWVFMIDGKPFEVRMNGSVTVNDSDAYVTCGLEGFGMIQPTLFMVLPHLLDGSLVEVLPDCNPKPKPISIVYPHNRHMSQKVRVFADWIAEVFEATPALEGGENWRGKVGVEAAEAQRGAVVA